MADESPKSNLLLPLLLAAGGAYLYYRNRAAPASDTSSNAWLSTPTGAATATSSPAPSTTSTYAAPAAASSTAPTVAASTAPISAAALPAATAPAAPTQAGFPLDGEPNIVFATASGRAYYDQPGHLLTAEYGSGSQNVRLNMVRGLGKAYHVFVEDIDHAIGFRFNQGGFNSWDDMYYSFINDPGSFAAVLTAYNQQNPYNQIAPRW